MGQSLWTADYPVRGRGRWVIGQGQGRLGHSAAADRTQLQLYYEPREPQQVDLMHRDVWRQPWYCDTDARGVAGS
jgi:hypothetical protein